MFIVALSCSVQLFQRYWEFVDLGANEDAATKVAVDEAVRDGYIISSSKKFLKATSEDVKQKAKEYVDEIKAELKGYVGPASGKPKVPSHWGVYKKKKEILMQIRQVFIEKVK